MSGQKIPLLAKVRSEWATFRGQRANVPSLAQRKIVAHKTLMERLDRYVDIPLCDVRALDIGCGQKAILTALMASEGVKVTGIDVELPTYNMDVRIFFESLRRNGWERALKSLARHVVLDKRLQTEISRQSGRLNLFRDLDVRVADATHLPFDDDSFDFVYSLAVLEHVSDVAAALSEVNRVLTRRGTAWLHINVYPSCSGGHGPGWADPDESQSETVPPWDHLRDNLSPPNTYLNKLGLKDYRELMQSHLDIVNEEKVEVGRDILTADIEAELTAKGYTQEDLLTAVVAFTATKKA